MPNFYLNFFLKLILHIEIESSILKGNNLLTTQFLGGENVTFPGEP